MWSLIGKNIRWALAPALFLATFLVALLAAFLAIGAQARSFGAGWEESEWSVNDGPFGCSLVHKVPGFGQVSLSRKAGGEELLQLQQQGKEGFPAGAIHVQAVPPPWRSDIVPVNLGLFNQGAALAPLKFTTNQVPMLLSQLEKGLQLVFSATQQAADKQAFRVLVSPKNFTPAYRRYRSCVNQLIPYSFEQMARITLYYQKDATELSTGSKTQLDKVARYSQADKQVLGVIVDAHSDARASLEQSQDVSRIQADLVTQYLIGKGMSLDMITSRWHGDKYPAASNGDEPGRAKNRRVTLRLENAGTRSAREKKIAEHKKSAATQQSSDQSTSTTTDSDTDDSLGLTLKELERMVESQDLTGSKSSKSKGVPKN
jgi:outer membrane protein OmpA-like peptidoglycan-associated protein